MSTAILNVWVTKLGDPCSIANDEKPLPHAWVVAVSDCRGRVVNWSEGRYRFHHEDPWTPIRYHTPPGGAPGWWYESIPTKDGHVEIELPRAAMSYGRRCIAGSPTGSSTATGPRTALSPRQPVARRPA